MMIRLMLVAMAALLLQSCSTVNCTKDLDRETFSVTITKGACMGQCPVYDGTVYGDATVLYVGRMNTERQGTWRGTVEAATLCELRTLIDENAVMQMKQDQTAEVQDAPMTTLNVTYKGQTRMIRWNLGTPQGLKPIVDLMIQATHENAKLTSAADSAE